MPPGDVAMPLTDTAIRSAERREKPYRLYDSGGLYLEIHPNGSKYWRLKYRYASKEKRLALGVYGKVSLKEARADAAKAKDLLENGGDPAAQRRTEKRVRAVAAANTFEVVAREWLDRQAGQWTPAHAERVLVSLERDIFPVLGKAPVSKISPPELLATIRAIEDREALETAQRVLQRCSAVFQYAIGTGGADANPAVHLKGTLRARKPTHYAALMAKDLPEFLQKLDAYQGDPQTQNALHLLLLTFVRTGELRAARWPEFDLEGATWLIPAERMKMGRQHHVPLSRQAIDVLRCQKALTGKWELVFPSRSNLTRPMSENTILFAIYRMGYHSRATGHGFRATASTILNEQGWRPDVIERQLAHVEKNKVRAAYHRSEYLEERRKMMQAWADYLDAIKTDEKVVNIRLTK